MPTYDYECKECGHGWELFQQITAKPIRKCPECGKLKARRVIGPGAGIIFKGSGFYQTDYRSKSYKDAAKADQAASKKSEASSSTGDSAKSSSSDSTSSNSKSSD